MQAHPKPANPPDEKLDSARFRSKLMAWYKIHARELPWRNVNDPYRTWLSEVMLQQTRVAAVIDHYQSFLRRFPTMLSLALATEPEVLAIWSGLGYYRRARMLHKAAQFLVRERNCELPKTAAELRTLPGIGEYTSAAIASIAFGESIAVVDGNVERVLLRISGRPESKSAEGRAYVQKKAAALIPKRSPSKSQLNGSNAPGDHNQAMMELGATICLPRAPLCLQCPVFSMCQTRGEHLTTPRAAQLSRQSAYLLSLRKRGALTEVLLEQRAAHATLMPGMYELPPIPLDAVQGREPMLRLRHAITNTNYYVQIYAAHGPADSGLRRAIPASNKALTWVLTTRLKSLPLTGLTRKALQRLDVMPVTLPKLPTIERTTAAST